MLDAKQVALQQRELFRKNVKWQGILDKLLAAWTLYFNFETGHEDPYNWTNELAVTGEGLSVCWSRSYSGRYGVTRVEDPRVVTTRLEILNVKRGRKWLGLRKKRTETTVLCLRHEVTIPKDDVPKQCWRVTKVLWKVCNVNVDRLVDIVNAIELLKRRAVGAEEDSEAQQERLKVFNDYLDGLADVIVKEG